VPEFDARTIGMLSYGGMKFLPAPVALALKFTVKTARQQLLVTSSSSDGLRRQHKYRHKCQHSQPPCVWLPIFGLKFVMG